MTNATQPTTFRAWTGLLMIHCISGLHPGSGTAIEVIDLPIQRERHTGWPIIPGSSLKGVLRSRAVQAPDLTDNETDDLFGPAAQNADKHAGSLSISDARILAFPVRSLSGVFAWVTAPAVLSRFMRDAGLNPSLPNPLPNRIPTLNNDEQLALIPQNSLLKLDDKELILEEFSFTPRPDPLTDQWADWFNKHSFNDPNTASFFSQHFCIISDDVFTFFVRHNTEVTARIALDPDKKTTQAGALFYEEFLPSETLMYTLCFLQNIETEASLSQRQRLEKIHTLLANPLFQLGADATIGKGFCLLKLVDA